MSFSHSLLTSLSLSLSCFRTFYSFFVRPFSFSLPVSLFSIFFYIYLSLFCSPSLFHFLFFASLKLSFYTFPLALHLSFSLNISFSLSQSFYLYLSFSFASIPLLSLVFCNKSSWDQKTKLNLCCNELTVEPGIPLVHFRSITL